MMNLTFWMTRLAPIWRMTSLILALIHRVPQRCQQCLTCLETTGKLAVEGRRKRMILMRVTQTVINSE